MAANYAVHDSPLGSVLAKPQGPPLCLQAYGLCPTAPPHPPSTIIKKKKKSAVQLILIASLNNLNVEIGCQAILKPPPFVLLKSKRQLS